MAGNKKKTGGRARQGHAADATGSMSSTSTAGVTSMFQAVTEQQDGHGTADNSASGDTASTPDTILQRASDVLAQLIVNDGGNVQAAVSQQQRRRRRRVTQGMPARASQAATATGEASTPAFNAPMLVAELNDSKEPVLQLLSLEIVYMCAKEHNSALIAAGIIPALLRLVNSSSEVIKGKVFNALMQLLWEAAGPAFNTSIIPQIVPLVRHHHPSVQYIALEFLERMFCNDRGTAQSKDMAQIKLAAAAMVKAGVIPAVTEALHAGLEGSRLMAAQVLMELSDVSGFGMDASLAGAVPVAVSMLECGTPLLQMHAACLLARWGSLQSKDALKMAVAKGAVPLLVPMLVNPPDLSIANQTQQAATVLLTSLVVQGGGLQQAVDTGAMPALVQLLHSSNAHTVFFAANALPGFMTQCSQAAGLAAAAGAVPPLVKMLNRGTDVIEWFADSCETFKTTGLATHGVVPFTDLPLEYWQAAALAGLHYIGIAGDMQLHADMVEAGAVLALGAALRSKTEKIRELAFQTADYLLDDDTNCTAAAAQLVSLLRSAPAQDQYNAMSAITQLVDNDSFRSALLIAGVLTAMVPLLQDKKHPATRMWAAHAMNDLAGLHDEAAEIAKAGAIPHLAQLLLNSPNDDSSEAGAASSAATVLYNLGTDINLHDQLAEVIPQLVRAMWGDNRDVCLQVGSLLQKLAEGGSAGVMRAFKAVMPQVKALLEPRCNAVQHYAAGAIYHYVVSGDSSRSSKKFEGIFKPLRRIAPGAPISEWVPLIDSGTLQ